MSIWARLVLVLALLGAAAAQAWWFYSQGYKARHAEAMEQERAAFKQNDRIQVAMQQDADKARGERDAKLRTVSDRLAGMLSDERMRQRARERNLPGDSGAAVGGGGSVGLPGADGAVPGGPTAGATGRDLSQPDAEWLARESAASNVAVAYLTACRAQYEAVRRRQPRPSP